VKPENVVFFATRAEFRDWLAKNHATTDSQWLGFFKKGAAATGITYEEAVLEALCFGWIDGQGAPIDSVSRAIRFTPRRTRTIWSAVNVKRVEELIAAGHMADAGMRAFDARVPERTGVYSHDSGRAHFTPDLEQRFRAHTAAWDFWNRQPPGYRRQMTWWVVSAKRDETRMRRMDALIAQHATGERMDLLHLPKLSAK
jgi:uncharacterized protein YdeI (YjbR/CyaY-like superfamily)